MPVLNIIALVTVVFIVGCSGASQSAAPVQQTTNTDSEAQAPRACPQGHDLRQVPMLVGFPTKDMLPSVRRGEALLTGCCGNPDEPDIAYVCDTCRQWKTATMAYWQPLPKDFGVERQQ